MTTEVDLQQLAIEREKPGGADSPGPRHLVSRYVLPGALLIGFVALTGWTSRNLVFPPRPVTVVPVLATKATLQRAGTPLFKAAGWIEPRPTPIRVAALAPGVVERLLVVEDQAVKAGEPVAELVKDDAQLGYERAAADLKLREAELQQVIAAHKAATVRFEQPVHLEAVVGEAGAMLAKIETELANLPFEVRRAQSQLQFAKANYEGKHSAGGVVSGRAIEQAKSDLDTAQALVDELRDRADSLTREKVARTLRLDALKKQLELLADETKAKEETEAKVDAAEARVEQARVAVREGKLRLDRMTVRAPLDGRVYQLIGYPGTTLSGGMRVADAAGGSTVVTLYQPERLQIRVDVRFEDIPNVTLGQPVEIENPALRAPLAGTVLFVSSEADIQKNTLQVKVAIDAPPPVFKPEMLVDATFLAPSRPEEPAAPLEELKLYVPKALVHRDDEGAFVWLADQSAGVVRRRPVETDSAAPEGFVEILRGLDASSRLVAGGHDELSDGDRIRITGEQPPVASDRRSAGAIHPSTGAAIQGENH